MPAQWFLVVRLLARHSLRRPAVRRRAATAATIALVALPGCKNALIPDYATPHPDLTTQFGFQTFVNGLFFGSRSDIGPYITALGSFARDAGNFENADVQAITEWLGDGNPIPTADLQFGDVVWENEYQMDKTADSILAALSGVKSPAPYSVGARAQISGVVNTMRALMYMYLAETRDTLGIPLGGIGLPPTATAPIYCNAHVWAYIVALLDSANTRLNVDVADALPIQLPSGFSAVSAWAGPSTRAGAFAAFNRALAGKANIELAYAIARGAPGSAPTPTTPGSPDPAALARADSAIAASALYQPASIAPPAVGDFSDQNAVYHVFSGASGDLRNPINGELNTLRILNEFVVAVDTAHDARWKNKFIVNPAPAQQPAYAGVSAPFIVDFYSTVQSPIPIIRNEGLALLRAQVRLGLGDFAGAWQLINLVRTQAGTLAPLAPTSTYATTRDALLREQRISTVLEGSGDRTISLRMYGLAAVADTTWGSIDTHATVLPIPLPEAAGRIRLTPVCP
jgi:hypothetical protein